MKKFREVKKRCFVLHFFYNFTSRLNKMNSLSHYYNHFPWKWGWKHYTGDDQILLYGPWNTEHIGREDRSQQSRGNGFSLSILPRSCDRICHSLHFCRSMNERAVTLYFSVHIKILLMHQIWWYKDLTITPLNRIIHKNGSIFSFKRKYK